MPIKTSIFLSYSFISVVSFSIFSRHSSGVIIRQVIQLRHQSLINHTIGPCFILSLKNHFLNNLDADLLLFLQFRDINFAVFVSFQILPQIA